MKPRLLTLVLLMAATPYASAQIYKCSDPNTGKINFTDVPCQKQGSSLVAGGNTTLKADSDLSTEEMTTRIRNADNAIHKAIVERTTKQAMHTNSKDEDPRFWKMLSESSWRYNANKACVEEQQVTRRQDIDKDRLIKCVYQRTEIHINQLAELSGDPDISKTLSSSIYPNIEHKPDTSAFSSEPVLLKQGKAGINQALAQGLLTVATQADLRQWQDKSGVATLPSFLNHLEKYNVKGNINLGGGLTGANAVVFIVPNALTIPKGDRGHSTILIMDNGSCLGSLCSQVR